jgi:hypothetical protein
MGLQAAKHFAGPWPDRPLEGQLRAKKYLSLRVHGPF